MSEKFLNSTKLKECKDILYLIGYINSKDLFIKKLLSDLIVATNVNPNSASFYLTLQKGHLSSKVFRQNFIDINETIFDHINLRIDQRQKLQDSLLLCVDNASRSLTCLYEFTERTTTLTFISQVVPDTDQVTLHNRKKIVNTFYLPAIFALYDNDKNNIFTIAGKNSLFSAIQKYKLIDVYKPTPVLGFYIPVQKYDFDSRDLVKQEAINLITQLTGFQYKDSFSTSSNQRYVYVMKDQKSFYIQTSEHIPAIIQ